jgi:type II secretion system protein H
MSNRARRGGFTLLELLVVLVIFAITAAAVVPAFLGQANTTPERRTANALVAVFTAARNAARESGNPSTVVIAPAERRYWLTTRDSAITAEIPTDPGVSLSALGGARLSCRFEAFGTASPCSVTVRGGEPIVVSVDQWTGDVLTTSGSNQ